MKLEIANLGFSYSLTPAIDSVSFNLEESQVLAIMGPNGAGKSTLLKCLAGILLPRSGQIRLDGQDLQSIKRRVSARRIAYVAQRGELSHLTVFDLVLLGRKPHIGWEASVRDLDICSRAIELCGLGNLALSHTDQIRGGEYQMAQIARALAQDPEIIALDEPTSSLDLANQHRIMGLLTTIVHSNCLTALVSMHDINLSLRYADRFILMKEGRIHCAGGREVITPDSIRAVYGIEVDVLVHGGIPLIVPV